MKRDWELIRVILVRMAAAVNIVAAARAVLS